MKINHNISAYQDFDLNFRTGKVFGTKNPILTSDFEDFHIGISYSAMPSKQSWSKKHENCCKISENQYSDLKFGTCKVFGTSLPILTSDLESFQIGVNYKILKN